MWKYNLFFIILLLPVTFFTFTTKDLKIYELFTDYYFLSMLVIYQLLLIKLHSLNNLVIYRNSKFIITIFKQLIYYNYQTLLNLFMLALILVVGSDLNGGIFNNIIIFKYLFNWWLVVNWLYLIIVVLELNNKYAYFIGTILLVIMFLCGVCKIEFMNIFTPYLGTNNNFYSYLIWLVIIIFLGKINLKKIER